MPTPIELSPGRLDQDKYSFGCSLSLSEAVSAQFTDELRNVIASNMVQPAVEVDELTREFHRSIDDTAPGVFASRFAHEEKWRHDGAPVHALLGQLAVEKSDISVAELVPGEAFMESLHNEVDDYRGAIETLKQLHDAWPSEVFGYLSELDAVAEDQSTEMGDRAFEIVRRMSENPEHLTLDPNHPEGLLLIPHLPWNVRRLTRRLLVGSHITARIDQVLGGSKTPEEEGMLSALQRYYTLDNLHGQHWEEGLVLSEDSQVQVAYYSAEQMATLLRLQKAADDESGQRFKQVWWQEAKNLKAIVEAVDNESDVSQWQLTDIGHAFEGFTTFDLMRAFRQGMYSSEARRHADFQPEKSGLRAVILEDDAAQRMIWKETVENSTSFTTEDALTFASPEGIEKVIDDPTVGLFLLDIQNGEDMTAGIRIGEEVLRRRQQLLSQEDAQGDRPKTKIIIWSASADAVEQANAHFKQLMEDEPMPGVSYSIGGLMNGSSGDSIEIEVRPKTFHTYADIE